MTAEQPTVRWETERHPDGWVISRPVHDGPCVFVDHQCSCGRLETGIIGEETGP